MAFSTQGVALSQITVSDDAGRNGTVAQLVFDELVADNPAEIRGSRKTLCLSTSTKHDSIAGALHICAVPQAIYVETDTGDASKFDAASVTTLKNIAQSSQNSKQFSSAEFLRPMAFNLGMASVVHGAERHVAAPTATPSAATLRGDLRLGGMSILLVYMPASATTQTFEIAVFEQLAAFYDAGTLLNSLAQNKPTRVPAGYQQANARQSTQVVPMRP